VPLHRALPDPLSGARGRFALVRCPGRDCGLAWLDPMPLEEDLRAAYGARRAWDQAEQGTAPPAAPWRAHPALRLAHRAVLEATGLARARRRLALLYLDRRRPGRVLDVGCGGGHLLARLAALGWDAAGQEVDPAAAEAARRRSGRPVACGPLDQVAPARGTLDAVTASHVLEHVADPVALLRVARGLLGPGGTLVAVTPNVGALGHRRFGARWRGLEPPWHVRLFGPRALAAAARRAGFARVETWSTAANADFFYLASQAPGAGAAARARSAPWRLRALAFQLAEAAAGRLVPGLGEELVLRARA
jgi:2-polyprenyl-3-methyl-5-hydroxy-6-metoxy-1,4-benzoquinol methylase